MKRLFLIAIVALMALMSQAQVRAPKGLDVNGTVLDPTELINLNGVTAPIQTQLNGKFDVSGGVPLSNDVFLKSFETLITLTDAATVTWNGSATTGSRKAKVTLAGSRTLSLTSPVAGQTYELFVTQDATGSRTLMLPTNVLWKGGIAGSLSTAPASIDKITMIYDGTYLFTTIENNWGANLRDKVVAHYAFDETSGTAMADAKSGLSATVYGGTLVNQTGVLGKCLKFDGTDDYATLPTNALLNNNVIAGFSFWANFADPAANFAFIYQQSTNDNSLLFSNDYNLLQHVRDGLTPNSQETSWGAITYNAWHLITWIYTGTALQIYVDATLKLSTASTGTLNSSANQWNIGRYFWGAGYWNGYIDELTVWKTAPTAAEITKIYNSGTGLAYTSW